MPITRKQQLLAKLETTPGGGATFSASDAIEVFDPALSDTVDMLDRSPASSTLSRDFSPVGRKQREITFTSDAKGSGTAATEPPWGDLIKSCAYRKDGATNGPRLLKIELGSVSGSFQLGEKITQDSAADVGIIVGIKSSGNAVKAASTADTDYLLVLEILGTLASSAATVGASSGATDSTGTVATTTDHHTYLPTSKTLLNLTIGTWSSGANPAAGEVFDVKNGSTLVGAVQLVEERSATDVLVAVLWGSVADTYTLVEAGGETSVIGAAPVAEFTPSIAMRHNLDGRNRLLLGSRGSFTCAGEVGQPLTWTWAMTGDVGTDADAVPIATTGTSTVRAPRLLGALCVYGEGVNLRDIQTKSISIDSGNTVSVNLDANSAGGSTGANVTDRDISMTVQVDNTLSTMDWESLRDAGTAVRVGFLLGTTAGNIMSVVAPNVQVSEVSIGDAEGVSVMDVTLRPRRVLDAGDDEIYFSQL